MCGGGEGGGRSNEYEATRNILYTGNKLGHNIRRMVEILANTRFQRTILVVFSIGACA